MIEIEENPDCEHLAKNVAKKPSFQESFKLENVYLVDSWQSYVLDNYFNLLPMPILGSSNSAANKDIKSMDKWGYNYLIE